MNATFTDQFGEVRSTDRAKRFRTTRECIALGHLLGAKQSLVERDPGTAALHIDSALVALRQLMAFEKEGRS